MCNIPKRNDEEGPISNLKRKPIIAYQSGEIEKYEYAHAWTKTGEKCSIMKDIRSNPRMRWLMKIIGSAFACVLFCLLVVFCKHERLNQQYEEVV